MTHALPRAGLVLRRLTASLALSVAVVAPFAAAPVACAAGSSAALVIDTGSSVGTYCVNLGSKSSVTGLELIKLADSQGLGVTYGLGYGGQAVCMLNGVGVISDDCLLDSKPYFWGYWHGNGSGGWTWSSLGAASTTVHAGDVEGWSWSIGADGVSHRTPPTTTYASVCGTDPGGGTGGGGGGGGWDWGTGTGTGTGGTGGSDSGSDTGSGSGTSDTGSGDSTDTGTEGTSSDTTTSTSGSSSGTQDSQSGGGDGEGAHHSDDGGGDRQSGGTGGSETHPGSGQAGGEKHPTNDPPAYLSGQSAPVAATGASGSATSTGAPAPLAAGELQEVSAGGSLGTAVGVILAALLIAGALVAGEAIRRKRRVG